MVKIGLQIKATLSNIDKLYPHDAEHFQWPLKVRCTGCGDEIPNWHSVSQDEVVEMAKSEANFYYKCKCCSRENYLSILPHTQFPVKKGSKQGNQVSKEYTSEDDGQFRTLVVFECRGLELTAFDFIDGWAAVSGTKVFTDVDLSDKEGWTEYNDVDNVPVEINSVEYQFITIKG